MDIIFPRRIRAAIYVLGVIGTPVVGYLKLKAFIGDAELTLWGSLVTAAFGLAALNLNPKQ